MNLPQTHKDTKKHKVLLFLFFFFLASAIHAYDLSRVKIQILGNGLTVMVLEDHTQPLVSTQVLYSVGGRNECDGTTGLAHFVEHMSFRATKNFPDTQEAIYAVGGEWHGYTWIDQTTYFETVPVANLDTVLRLQADRMSNVLNRAEEIEAERGAVLTELHGYENDPASVLYDQVLAVSFLQHPYRNNTIGWVSDVEKLTHENIAEFYHRYYLPSNAVLAIAGDVKTADVLIQVQRYFGAIVSKKVSSLPLTKEPLQQGERRLVLYGAGPQNYFQITYRAPAARDPDFAAFLLLQAIFGGSSGVNFRQGGFGEDVRPGTRLSGIGTKLTTFFVATAQPYVFNIAGRSDMDPARTEEMIEKQVHQMREQIVSAAELERARKNLLSELIFDIETTEDAAHQMAYFEGIDAFSVLKALPSSIKRVTAEQIRTVAQKYLKPEQRTIGWYLVNARGGSGNRSSLASLKDEPGAATASFYSMPHVTRLKNGIPVIVQRIARTPAGFLRILIPTNSVEGTADFTVDDPVWRFTSFHWRFLREDLDQTIQKAATLLGSGLKTAAVDPTSMDDPEYRLKEMLQQMLGATKNSGEPLPAVISVVGDVDEARTLALLDQAFGKMKQGKMLSSPLRMNTKEQATRMPGKAQSQFGYAIPAPAPSREDSYAYRVLLFIMTHGYGGRLGKELIGRTGLLYYISSNYNSDAAKASWISISFGVNPGQLQPAKTAFEELMRRLLQNPPTEGELAEAKEHLIGRRITAYQSNEELSAFLTHEFLEQGRILDQAEYEKRVRAVTLQQVLKIIPSFLNGVTAVVDTR